MTDKNVLNLPIIRKEEVVDKNLTVATVLYARTNLEAELRESITAFEKAFPGIRIGNMNFQRKADPITRKPSDVESVQVFLALT